MKFQTFVKMEKKAFTTVLTGRKKIMLALGVLPAELFMGTRAFAGQIRKTFRSTKISGASRFLLNLKFQEA